MNFRSPNNLQSYTWLENYGLILFFAEQWLLLERTKENDAISIQLRLYAEQRVELNDRLYKIALSGSNARSKRVFR